jgi:hypothetical protein
MKMYESALLLGSVMLLGHSFNSLTPTLPLDLHISSIPASCQLSSSPLLFICTFAAASSSECKCAPASRNI